jgi:hypothetical protein
MKLPAAIEMPRRTNRRPTASSKGHTRLSSAAELGEVPTVDQFVKNLVTRAVQVAASRVVRGARGDNLAEACTGPHYFLPCEVAHSCLAISPAKVRDSKSALGLPSCACWKELQQPEPVSAHKPHKWLSKKCNLLSKKRGVKPSFSFKPHVSNRRAVGRMLANHSIQA